MIRIINDYAKLSVLLEQYQTAEKTLAEVEMQQEALYRMSGEFSKELESAKHNVVKAIKVATATRDAYIRTIQQLTNLNPEEFYKKLIKLSSSLDAAQQYRQEEAEFRTVFEILAETDGFSEDSPRADFEAKLELIDNKATVAEEIAERKLVEIISQSKPLVVSTATVLQAQ